MGTSRYLQEDEINGRRDGEWITQLDAGGSKFSKAPQGSGVDRHGVTVDILVKGEKQMQSSAFRV